MSRGGCDDGQEPAGGEGGAHHVADLGIEPLGFFDDEYAVALNMGPRHLNIGGIVHGGVLCSLLDTAMARAFFMPESGETLSAATLEMKVNFLASCGGGRLEARARVVHRTRRTAYVEGRVVDQDGRVIARASSTMLVFAEGKSR
ncbi:MAG: PaaI family thioesterase [Candidatus Eisenbacteria bacterium]|uniref:PaaI family thioesterase n=1 Tax=Eiseniibacteriota bacterium TaxID=2212470 RepID=A0A937X982_UNCEI|nr:PaaI family thioesterase [Candidatus Eisenbacteria bacterium]